MERRSRRSRRPGVWLGPVLVLAMVAAPVVGIIAVSPAARTWPAAAAVAGMVACAILLISTGLVYITWRLAPTPVTAWLIVALATVSLQGIGVFGLMMGDSTETRSLAGWQTVASIPTLVLLAALPALRRRTPPIDPLAVGCLLGLTLAISRYALAIVAPPFDVSFAARIAFVGAAGLVLGVAVRAFRDDAQPAWVARSCALTVALFGTATAVLYLSGPTAPAAAVSIAAHVAGAVIAQSTAAAVLHLALRADHETVEDLERRLEEVAASGRLERERRHEIGSIVAGICSASRLVRQADRIEHERAVTLEQMLDSEMARLERLVDDRPLSDPAVVDVDGVLRPLVTAQRAQGRLVTWEPSGHTTVVSPDVLSEVVCILLQNAARHAPGGRVDVAVEPLDGRLRVRVSDDGPGVAAEVREHLFDWQTRGPQSPGQGIGLHIARRLMTEAGGALDLVDDGPGATFVATLPAPASEGGRS